MIDGRQLLSDLQPQLRALQEDLLTRSREVPELDRTLRDEWQQARAAERTAQAFEAWREDALAQAAVMWLLGCVFVRFLEDNRLIDPPSLAGPGDRLGLARDQHTLYFQQHPHDSDRDYLLHVFDTLSRLPGSGPLFDRRHNPVWTIGISGDAAGALLAFWQEVDPDTGVLLRDFTDADWNTRFLGDLYQDLSESARKRYALLQTPDFVLQFILDRTLTPAIDEFGFREVRMIDPACGSGHFLLAAFERLFHIWSQQEPGRNPRDLAQRALAQVAGVDVNPFAVAIARFRLLLAALRASNVTRLSDAPAFAMEVAAGDSLLHGPRPGAQGARQMYLDPDQDPIGHVYATEDADDLRRILGRRCHVVVGNPPYITVKDSALNKAYRERFPRSCHMKYSLAVPFTERFFDLAVTPEDAEQGGAGYVGMITANSFMKREFGRKLIEECLPAWDLTHVIDTSGAYIPGHGTPTVILFGRHQAPVADTVRAVLGIRGEPSTPDVPAEGKVWSAILSQVDRPGSSSEFVSAGDTARATFQTHPWSIGGGGAAELKERLDDSAATTLGEVAAEIGITSVTGEDDVYLLPDVSSAARLRIESSRPVVTGEIVRDWSLEPAAIGLWLYDDDFGLQQPEMIPHIMRLLWLAKARIRTRKRFGTPMLERGLTWYEWQELYASKLRTPISITFAFVATHNHFVLDRGGKVFNRTAPVIKLPADATEDDHLVLLGLLNSSTACFWMKQTFFDRGNGGIGGGIANEEWERFYEHDATKLTSFPLPPSPRIDSLVAACQEHADALLHSLPQHVLARPVDRDEIARSLDDALAEWRRNRARVVGLQEELDWQCYERYGLVKADGSLLHADPPPVRLGERAFEIVMARKMTTGELETAWFERHGSTPVTEIPEHWPQAYRDVVARRIEAIEANAEIALIEQSEYKRRWNVEPFDEQLQRALRSWLLDRLESPAYWPSVELTSVARLADAARRDDKFMRVAALYRGEDTFDVATLVEELVTDDSVPFLPVLRYRPTGRRKREVWEQTWALQRQEDAIDGRVSLPEGDPERLSKEDADDLKRRQVGDIPVPPKYTSADFLSSTFWRLRGKLDVPKERFISYPHAERDADPTLVIGWAGWDHLQQAQALASYYVQMRDSEGWTPERLTPLLAGLLELAPWLKQWHNDPNNEYGTGMGDYYAGFVDGELRGLGKTVDEVRGWAPAARTSGRRRGSSGALS